jgi:hypothetical protein
MYKDQYTERDESSTVATHRHTHWHPLAMKGPKPLSSVTASTESITKLPLHPASPEMASVLSALHHEDGREFLQTLSVGIALDWDQDASYLPLFRRHIGSILFAHIARL